MCVLLSVVYVYVQLKAILRDRTSVLAGPSGVGKSSIINALRFVAMDSAQRNRLAKFEDAMATENDWRFVDSNDSDESSGSDIDVHSAGPQPVRTHAAETDAVSNEAAQQQQQQQQQQRDVEAPAASRIDGDKPASEQAAWKRRSGSIYGAQVQLHSQSAVFASSTCTGRAQAWLML